MKLKKVSFDEIEIEDIIILKHNNGEEILVGELTNKYKSEGWYNILNGWEKDPREWIKEKYVPDSWFLEIKGSFTKFPKQSLENVLCEYGVSSRWYECYIYETKKVK